MRYFWTDERYQITYSKRVTLALKMVDSCSREIEVLYTVDESHQAFWFEQFFNGKLCCQIHDLLSVPIILFWIGLLGAISRWISNWN